LTTARSAPVSVAFIATLLFLLKVRLQLRALLSPLLASFLALLL
jgi:hypothetical protein